MTNPPSDRNGAPNAFDPEGMIPCKFCGVKFKPIRPWQLFHNRKCRNAYWNIQYILNYKLGDEE